MEREECDRSVETWERAKMENEVTSRRRIFSVHHRTLPWSVVRLMFNTSVWTSHPGRTNLIRALCVSTDGSPLVSETFSFHQSAARPEAWPLEVTWHFIMDGSADLLNESSALLSLHSSSGRSRWPLAPWRCCNYQPGHSGNWMEAQDKTPGQKQHGIGGRRPQQRDTTAVLDAHQG